MNEATPAAAGVNGRSYIASLTGLRGIAAFSVFLFHYSALHPGIRLDLDIPVIGYFLMLPLGLGSAGVDLFFVLSGFLLSLPFARAALAQAQRPPTAHYIKRRLLRVFPAYYAQWAIILLAGGWFITWHSLDAPSIAAHVFMFFYIGPDPVQPLVGLWWTLPVELSFYLLLPFLFGLMQPRRWIALVLVMMVFSAGYRYWAAVHFADGPGAMIFLTASQLPGSLPEFLLGASAAMLVQWRDLRQIPKPSERMLDALFLVGAVLTILWLSQVLFRFGSLGLYWRGHWSMIIAPTALGCSLSLIVLSVYWGSRLGKLLFANRAVYFIGLISYSLYLWHFVIMQQLQMVGGSTYANLPGFFQFMLSSVLVIALSALSYALFERPFFRLRGERSTS